jgi:hypothetical protein
MNIHRSVAPALLSLLLIGAAACGSTASGAGGDDADAPSAGTCVAGVTDCVDTVDGPIDDPGDLWGDEFPSEQARQDARAVLGMNEADLDDGVRIARRGSDEMMLTEDYVLGRLTVELDDDGSGYRVTSVVVELPDGPESFELEAS